MATDKAKATAPVTAAPASGVINMDEIINQVMEELKAAESEVNEHSAKLAAAREKLAAARGKMEMLGQMQRMSAGNAQASE